MAEKAEQGENPDLSETGLKEEAAASHKVNSTATYVVKSYQGNVPLTFARLEQNTNLHLPPSNWLKSGSHIDARNTWVRGGSGEFSSFAMASQLPEKVGEVDVISASENIKKLLKIPFSTNQVSMAVHRVEKTLLLDELDLLKELRYTSETGRDWVKECLLRRVLQDGQTLTTERKTNQMLQNQNLLSKFLCYSVGDQDPVGAEAGPDRSVVPVMQQGIPQKESRDFAHQVLWEFEDICMLIGSDLPIFGEGKYPAVSLRLRDMTNPINVLTGMDYWLDNLMCNVPELVMCYHLNGIVQKYEMLKTEEIPHLEDAKFSTKVVKDIAQNILSFLKSNCTKEGHTYWLYKGNDDDVVKLYDLTSLCDSSSADCPWDNPFIVPVALLLYRVAKNMSAMNPTKKQNAVITKLLKECVKLLRESGDRHPEISSSAYYMLTLIHIKDGYAASGKGSCNEKGALSPTNSIDDDDDEIVVPKVEGHQLMLPYCAPQQEIKSKRKSPKRRETSADKDEIVLDYITKSLKYIHSTSVANPTIPLPSPEQFKKNEEDKKKELSLSNTGTSKMTDQTSSRVSPGASGNKSRVNLALVPTELFPREIGQKISQRICHQGDEANSEDTHSATEIGERSFTAQSDTAKDSGNLETLSRGKVQSSEKAKTSAALCVASDNTENVNRICNDGREDENIPQGCEFGLLPSASSNSTVSVGGSPQRAQKERDQNSMNLQHFPADSWQMEVQLSLLSQAAQVYFHLAEDQSLKQCYGRALLYSRIGLLCDAVRSEHSPQDPTLKDQKPLSHRLWMICGDALLLMTNDLTRFKDHRRDLEDIPDNHAYILKVAASVIKPEGIEWDIEVNRSREVRLKSSIACYTRALKKDQGQTPNFLVTVARKIGNAKNELGVALMSRATECLKRREGSAVTTEENNLWKQSLSTFENGIEAFEEVGDNANTALLLCNCGRLMRLCAQSHAGEGSSGTDGQMSMAEKHCYTRAFKYYEQALTRLRRRKESPQIWDAVSWELCTSQYNLGCLLQDHPPISIMAQEAIEKEVQDCFNKSLRLCDSEDKNPSSQPLYQYRMASIHHRLASMYHNMYRNQNSPQKQRRIHGLLEIHYDKAYKYFVGQERYLEVLRILLERIAVLEFQLTAQSAHGVRAKSFQSILRMLVTSTNALTAIQRRCEASQIAAKDPQSVGDVRQKTSMSEEEFDSDEKKDLASLVPLLESRIKVNLLAVMKHLSSNKSNAGKLQHYKKIYGEILASTHSFSDAIDITSTRIQTIRDILKKLESLTKNHPLG